MSGIEAPRELVLASAGSGKTHRISSRLIGLLAYGAEPEEVLAATFTRKAAGQILERVLARLAGAVLASGTAGELAASAAIESAPPLPPEPAFWAGVLERAVRDLHRFNVGTLDAFFMRAATSFNAELDLRQGWRIPDRATARRLQSRALQGVLATEDPGRLVELLRLVAAGDARRSVHARLLRVMDELLAIDDQLDPAVDDPWSAFTDGDEGLPKPTPADRERLAAALERIELPTTKSGRPNQSWIKALTRLSTALREGDWDAVAVSTLCQRVATANLEYNGAAIDSDLRACIEAVLDAARAVLRPRLGGQIQALGQLTAAYRDHYRDRQRAEGLYTFADVTRLLGGPDPLGERTDLYYRLDARTRHILLDEFQDTSLPQWEALKPLVDEVLSDDGRAGVIVADPKQSIYGWRGAQPGIVHDVGKRYSLDSEHMAINWRSSQIVLDFVNSIFAPIAESRLLRKNPTDEATARAWVEDFRDHRASRDRPGHVRVEVGPLDEGRGGQKPLLFRRAAERIAELYARSPGFTIGVLTRTNQAVARLILELREQAVPVSQEGGNPLTDSAACEAMLALLRMADHPADTIARYHLANSPLGEALGFSDYRDDRAALELSRSIRRRLVVDGYGETITRLAKSIVTHCDARDARRLGQLAELAHGYDGQATLRPTDFVRLVEEERVDDRASARVRVMTVHQAKGLEFDIVVLPELHNSMVKGRTPAALAYRPNPSARVTAVLPGGSAAIRCLFPELEEPAEQLRAAGFRDELSALYVALTRARYALHVLIPPDGKNGPGEALTPARLIREAIAGGDGDLPPAITDRTLFETGTADWSADPRAVPEGEGATRAPAEAPRVRILRDERIRFLPRQSPSQLHAESRVDIGELLNLGNVAALDRGSVVHAWFEQLAWVDEPQAPDHALLELGHRIAPGLSDAELRSLLAEYRDWLRKPPIRDVLTKSRYPGAVRLEREMPFIQRLGGTIVEGAIDRLVVQLDGDRPIAAEVIDFKTDRVSGGEVASRAARYAGQLGAYLRAVSALYSLAPGACRGTLVFLQAGRIVTQEIDEVEEPTPPLPT